MWPQMKFSMLPSYQTSEPVFQKPKGEGAREYACREDESDVP